MTDEHHHDLEHKVMQQQVLIYSMAFTLAVMTGLIVLLFILAVRLIEMG